MRVKVASPAVIGPGLPDWNHAQAVLRGEIDHQPAPVEVPPASLLSPRERRRLTPTIRLALALGEACTHALDSESRSALPTVFASMAGDIDVADRLCTALATPERAVSPTQFHNSVHNAAAGYWAIAVGSPAPSTSIAARDGTAATGLLEAAGRCAAEGQPVLLLIYDVTPPARLAPSMGYDGSFGIALQVLPVDVALSSPVWQLTMRLENAPETRMEAPWEHMRLGNPAARTLPLLQAMAHGSGRVAIPKDGDRQVMIEVAHGH